MYKPDRILGIALALLVAACGGGGGGGGGNPPPAGGGWVMGVFAPSTNFDALCVSPRSGINPATLQPFPDQPGTVTDQNNFLRSWTNELYLWYSEVPDTNPMGVATENYFDTLMTPALTPSGNPKDRFHFTFPTAEWFALAQSGVQAGYGATWALLAVVPPRRALVAYTEPNSPATAPAVNLARGAEVLTVDGIDLVNNNTQAGVDIINEGLFPSAPDRTHTFGIRDLGSQTTRVVTMTSTNVTSVPVQNVSTVTTGSGEVGYLLFNDHIATAEAALINAINTLQAASVIDLVIDIRYNGGGFLDIANELAFMIAGPGRTTGQTFERLEFSDKYPNMNPVTQQSPVRLFTTTSLGFSPSIPRGTPLPTLNLARVFVLTGPGTCSASEAIINSLRGVGVQVIQVGSTTCGKPYGFYPVDNCGTTYFSIQFRGVNAMNFGEYPDGFSPQNTLSDGGVRIPGCSVGDDFTRALGDPAEARLAAALGYRTSSSCPAATGFGKSANAAPQAADGVVYKSPWLENRILRE
jgi:C-terminal processing protease CtpA/Prc